jgi:hypothetical protein
VPIDETSNPPPIATNPEEAEHLRVIGEEWLRMEKAFPGALERAIRSGEQITEAWVRLAQSVAPKGLDPASVERSVRTALAIEQAQQLVGDPPWPLQGGAHFKAMTEPLD